MRTCITGIVTFLLVASCAGQAVNTRLRELDAKLTPIVGQHKEVALQVLGPPQESFAAGETEVWKYHVGYGTKTRYARNVITGEYLGSAKTWERYDEWELTIIADTVRTYKTYVQR